ncbi:hypothetical protein Tco_0425376 [Tanacetum coccineum]
MFMHTARDKSILGPMRFVSKSDDFQVYGTLLPNKMTNQQMRDSNAYKTYLAYATNATSPKMKRKFKKPASPSKKRTLVTVEEEEPKPDKKDKPVKKPTAKRYSIEKGSQKKKTRNKHSSSVCRDEDADDQQGGDERTKSDNEQTETDNPKISDDEEEIQDDEFVHTPEDYVPTDDETNDESNDVTEEEYERINEDLYGDVNVSLTDVEPAKKEKDDEEMTVTSHINVNQEGAGNQVKDDAQATQKTDALIPSSSILSDYAAKFLNFDNIPSTDTEVIYMMDINVQHEVPHTSSLLTISVSIIPEQDVINQSETVTTSPAPTISSFLSSLYPALQQIAPIPAPTTTEVITLTTVVPDSETLAAFQLRVTDLEKDVKELKDVDNSTKVISTIQSEVPKAVKEYLGSSKDNAMYKVIQRNFADIVKEHSIPAEIVERLGQQCAPQKSIEDI